MTDRDELKAMLARLNADVLDLLRDMRDPDAFWPAFATASNAVLDAAGPDQFDWVSSEIDEILLNYGLPTPEA